MNPLLQKAETAYKAKIDPRLMPVVMKIVKAGQQIMYSPQSRRLMQEQLSAGPDNPEVISAGIAKLLGILHHASRGTAPPQALIPAGMLLLFDGLQFLEDAGAVKVTPQFLAQCTQATGSALLQLMGVHPEQVQNAIDQARTKVPQQPAPQPGPAPAPAGIIGSAMGGA